MLHRPIIALFALVLVLGGCTHSTETDFSTACPGQMDVVLGSSDDLIKNVGHRVFFKTDQSILSEYAEQVLGRQAAWMTRYDTVHLTIEGHADERGTREYNLALGERRANAVRNYLIGRGVAASRINTISYGKERPEVAGKDDLSLAKNRRAVSIVQ